MIVIDAGKRDAKSFDSKILFASQLLALGHAVVVDEGTAPQELGRFQKYETAPLLADMKDVAVSGYILIGAEAISDDTLMLLRSYNLPSSVPVSAIGRFPDYQALITASSRIAFALGREANVIDLNEIQISQILNSSISPLVAAGGKRAENTNTRLEVVLYLPPELLDEPMTLPVLGAMNFLSAFHLNVITSGMGKETIQKSKFSDITVFGIVDLPPATFAKIANIAAFFGEGVPGERMASFALDLLKSGGAVIDCTNTAAFITSGAPVLRGPEDLQALANYLDQRVFPNLNEIGLQSEDNIWLQANSIERLEAALKLPAPKEARLETGQNSNTVFVPTNGNGLGHAQRCALVASALPESTNSFFAAFPSCISLIRNSGFSSIPLIQKSPYHSDDYANDLVNYLRLRSRLRTGDNLVFDGGYVFDSVYRVIKEKSLNATWIRRGLWRPGQIKQSTLDRENAFEKVIVPNEAFEELNASYTYGEKVVHVGPIVQDPAHNKGESESIRDRLKTSQHHDFDELVVTMLGGGVAADRSAQMQALCALLGRRPNCLHLIIVWPGSKISPNLFNWKNTRVVKTQNALALCQAADLVVSAVGYNSFHEILYHKIPSILIPQIAPFMDDQEKRARAASNRELAVTVLATEFIQLEREVEAFLEGGKADEIRKKLDATELPPLGTNDAAAIISGQVTK